MKKILVKTTLLLILGVLVLALSGCASNTVPYTGRTQYLAYSEAEEAELGTQAWGQILAEEKVSNNAQLQARLNHVASRIVAVSGLEHLDWEFKVIESDVANAFALPGGKVAFYTGIFPYFADDDQLAVVVAHEVAHVVARHSNEGMTQSNVANAGVVATAIGAILVFDDEDAATLTTAAASGVLNYGFLLPYSRTHESEADEIGIVMMAEAGFNVDAAIPFWQKFGTNNQFAFLSTHPASSERVKNISRVIKELRNGTHVSGVVIK